MGMFFVVNNHADGKVLMILLFCSISQSFSRTQNVMENKFLFDGNSGRSGKMQRIRRVHNRTSPRRPTTDTGRRNNTKPQQPKNQKRRNWTTTPTYHISNPVQNFQNGYRTPRQKNNRKRGTLRNHPLQDRV